MIGFEEAKQDKNVRQRYLEEIDFEEFKPYVSDVIYIDDTILSRVPIIMTTVSPPDTKKSLIWVYKTGFEGIMHSESDLLSYLVDHEGVHAEQHFQGRQTLTGTDLKYLRENGLIQLFAFKYYYGKSGITTLIREREIEAHRRQLDKIESRKRKVSSNIEKSVRLSLEFNLNLPLNAHNLLKKRLVFSSKFQR